MNVRWFGWYFAALLAFMSSAYARELPDFTELVDKQGPAVVNVSTTQVVRNDSASPIPGLPEDDPMFEFFRRFMPPGAIPREQEARSLGSGFIISSDGYILTNAHVVDAADEVTVSLTDKREFKAKVIGSDRRTDVALIKINATGLPRVTIGDPNQLRVGEWVAAIGAPFGFENSVTAGIVSAKGRSLPRDNFVPFIQTDVAINPGNSGGPLFNLRGEVVGINSQIYSRTGGFMGLSFAIPIDVALEVSNQLRTSGKVSRGWLGVAIQEVTRQLADSFGLPQATGALIASIEPNSPADKAGLQVSDVVLRFNDKVIASANDLPRIVAATKPGTRVNMQVWRKGQTRDLSVQVAELPAERAGPQQRGQRGGAPNRSFNKFGLAVSELTPTQRQQLRLDGGLFVEDTQGVAARAGVRRGDIILAVNNSDVRSVEQFNQLINQVGPGRNIALLVRRGDSALYIPLRAAEGEK